MRLLYDSVKPSLLSDSIPKYSGILLLQNPSQLLQLEQLGTDHDTVVNSMLSSIVFELVSLNKQMCPLERINQTYQTIFISEFLLYHSFHFIVFSHHQENLYPLKSHFSELPGNWVLINSHCKLQKQRIFIANELAYSILPFRTRLVQIQFLPGPPIRMSCCIEKMRRNN